MSPHRLLALILDRSPETLVLLRDVVEESGLAAVARSSGELKGEELVEFIVAHRPDVVLYDIPAPYESNLENFRAIRSDPRVAARAWIALSTSSSVIEQLQAQGECVVLGKPFDPKC